MQMHQIKPTHKLRQARRKGRGGKRGTYSGRGSKGQKARAGAKIRPQVRDMMLKFPKKRGASFKSRKPYYFVVSLANLKKAFPQGGIITPKKIEKQGLIPFSGRKKYKVKILGALPLKVKYTIKGCQTSKAVEEAIVKAGGKIIVKK